MNKKNNNNPEELDQLFKDGLNNFQAPPPGLRKLEKDHPIDEVFKNKLNDMEPTPSPTVWENVKTRIPYNLKVKRQLTWWTKVAAALIIGLAATVALKEYQAKQAAEMANQPAEKEAVPAIPIDSDFVYELRKGKKGNEAKSTGEKSAREILSDEVVVFEDRSIEPIEPLKSKVELVVSSVESPLDEQQKASSEKLGEVPIRTVNTTDVESLSLKNKEEKEQKEKNQ